jgi:hypothetical protein
MGTLASAGGFSCFSILFHVQKDQRYHCKQNDDHKNGTAICQKKFNHMETLLCRKEQKPAMQSSALSRFFYSLELVLTSP